MVRTTEPRLAPLADATSQPTSAPLPSAAGARSAGANPALPPAEHAPARVVTAASPQAGVSAVALQAAQRSAEVRPLDPAYAGLTPKAVWQHFNALNAVPRPSKHEDAARAMVLAWAASRGFPAEVDAVGNVLVRVNAGAPGTVVGMQGHLDMVCVADVGHPIDFSKDGIAVRRDGDFITAKGTTLGSDNGIGVAYAMALAEECKGPLELLFTVDEEDGMSGVAGVKPGWLRATKMLNLDSEEEGFLTIASAGGRDLVVELPLPREAATTSLTTLEVEVAGLKGGHSGIEIHRGRTNGIQALGKVLELVLELGGTLYGLSGGSKRNAIPVGAKASVGVPANRVQELHKGLAALAKQLATSEDPNIALAHKPTAEGRQPVSSAALARLCALMAGTPTGVIKATAHDATQPFVSNNLGIIAETSTGVALTSMARSPSVAELDAVAERFATLAKTHGAECKVVGTTLGWEADYDSKLLATCRAKFRELFGKDAKLLEIHAGLECGALRAKYPGMEVISFGPDITGAHTSSERLSIPSTQRTYELLRAVVAALHAQS